MPKTSLIKRVIEEDELIEPRQIGMLTTFVLLLIGLIMYSRTTSPNIYITAIFSIILLVIAIIFVADILKDKAKRK